MIIWHLDKTEGFGRITDFTITWNLNKTKMILFKYRLIQATQDDKTIDFSRFADLRKLDI